MSAQEKGLSFEEAVLELFRKRGYQVELHQFPKSQSGAEHEIDIYGFGKRKEKEYIVGCECKFKEFGERITKGEIAEWVIKCHDCRIQEGYFATNSDYNENALKLTAYYTVETMDGKILNKMFKEENIKYYCRLNHFDLNTPAANFARNLFDRILDPLILRPIFGEKS